MADFGTTFERLELKFLISEMMAESIRQFVAPWCRPDDHNGSGITGGYPIYSLYLDTPNREFYHAWRRRDADRIKLRVRSYGTDSGAPAFLEVKRKVVDVIAKDRVAIDPETVADAVAGFGKPHKASTESWSILDRFAQFASRTGAEPASLIRYEREAWVGEYDRYARVTFDRHLTVRHADGFALQGVAGASWLPVDECWRFDQLQSPVVLELKCETQIPLWMSQIIETYELRARGFSKYGYGIDTLHGADAGVDTRSLEVAPYV